MAQTNPEKRNTGTTSVFDYERTERQALGNRDLEIADRLLRKHRIDGHNDLIGHIVTQTIDLAIFDSSIPVRAAGEYALTTEGTDSVLTSACIEIVSDEGEPQPTFVVHRDMSNTTSFIASAEGLGEGYSLRAAIDYLEHIERYFDNHPS